MTLPMSEALVLRTLDFGESDCIVHLLTPEAGRLTAIAKGAKRSHRRFPGTLDLLNHLHIQVAVRRRAGAMARLEHSRLVGCFPGLRRDPTRFALGCYVLELFDQLAPEGTGGRESEGLFRFALLALATLERQEPTPNLRIFLELHALHALGLRPELRRCVRCARDLSAPAAQTPTEIGFHIPEGGPVCGACSIRVDGLLTVHLGTLRTLDQSLRLGLDRLGRLALGGIALAEAQTLLRRFQRFHVGVELRSERFLDELRVREAVGSA